MWKQRPYLSKTIRLRVEWRLIETVPKSATVWMDSENSYFIGNVKWHRRWQCFVYVPDGSSTLHSENLRALAHELDAMTEDRKRAEKEIRESEKAYVAS